MLLLGIESSCDETAFAVVENGRRVLSNAIASQVEIHARFGGVVPEVASRAHLEALQPLLRRALEEAGTTLDAVDGIAVTRGPGLSGCLLVGLEFAKGLSLRAGKPLYAVQHIAGHLLSVFLGRERNAWGDDVTAPWPERFEPYVAYAVSGGHSSLVHVRGPLDFETLGQTLDDAVGEAYDKVAKVLGLGYPGGPLMDRLAKEGNPAAFDLPRPMAQDASCDVSFSGLKASVARLVEKEWPGGATPSAQFQADVAASFQAAAIDVLVSKAKRGLERTGLRRLAVTGGVASNRGLRAALAQRLPGVQVAFPEPEFCTDNAAMIAGAGYWVARQGAASGLGLNAAPGLALAPAEEWGAV